MLLLLDNGYSVDGRYNISSVGMLAPIDGDTALSSAVTPIRYDISNVSEAVKFLLNSGASVNASNPLGWNILHFARTL